MRKIIGYIGAFVRDQHPLVLIFCIVYSAALVILNFGFGLERRLATSLLPYPVLSGRILLYALAYFPPLLLVLTIRKKPVKTHLAFLLSILLAPVLFAIKVCVDTHVTITNDIDWNRYWNAVIYWPARLVILLTVLMICWYSFNNDKNKFGLVAGKISYRPYFFMVMLMLPLIAIAATQADFHLVYPKLKVILPLPVDAARGCWYKLLYEIGYGTDFFSIEVFFRGFLVIGLTRWLGKDAILPMACFYCSIHFGKPLGECISSFFGGTLLGIVSYHTRSIYGGLIVHLGIAWLMELAALGIHVIQ